MGLWAAPVAAEPVVIAALGDSLTQGYGLVPEDGFVPQLQGWLVAEGAEVEVRNAGVSGDTTAGGLSRLDWTLTEDVDAMIVALGGNDLLRGIDPEVSKANLDAILTGAAERDVEVLLIGLPAPGNYGPEWKAAFDGMYPELAETHGVLWEENFLAAISEAETPVALMQADGIHPNKEGVVRILERIGPRVLELIGRIEK